LRRKRRKRRRGELMARSRFEEDKEKDEDA
jgi:hypothetical protein